MSIPYLWCITAPNFTAGIETTAEGNVIDAAPIVRYMVGWGLSRVSMYCRHRRWNLDLLDVSA